MCMNNLGSNATETESRKGHCKEMDVLFPFDVKNLTLTCWLGGGALDPKRSFLTCKNKYSDKALIGIWGSGPPPVIDPSSAYAPEMIRTILRRELGLAADGQSSTTFQNFQTRLRICMISGTAVAQFGGEAYYENLRDDAYNFLSVNAWRILRKAPLQDRSTHTTVRTLSTLT